MADKYLVECGCGRVLPVGANQAGSRVTCECGNQVEIPPLRKLHTLPMEQSQETTTTGEWSGRHSVTFALTLLAVALAGYGLWLRVNEPEMPVFGELYQQAIGQDASQMLERGRPIDFWRHWMLTSPVLREQGFATIVTPQQEAYERGMQDYRARYTWLLSTAGVVAALAVVAWLAWPRTPQH